MYLIPIALIVLVALIAVAWSPIFALIIFVLGFIAFLAWAGASRRADEKLAPPSSQATDPHNEDDETPTGIWGERRA